MKLKAVARKRMIALTLIAGLCLALAGAAEAGGGRMGGGFRGGGRSGFHRGFHGGHFKHGSGVRAGMICSNGTCLFAYAVGSLLPSSDYGVPYLAYPEYVVPPDVPSLAVQPRLEIAPALPQEACSAGGCYRLRGDGLTIPYQWVWVPAPPPPPLPPAVLPYPGGRYEQRGPSHWVWVPDAPTVPPSATPAAPPAAQPGDLGLKPGV